MVAVQTRLLEAWRAAPHDLLLSRCLRETSVTG